MRFKRSEIPGGAGGAADVHGLRGVIRRPANRTRARRSGGAKLAHTRVCPRPDSSRVRVAHHQLGVVGGRHRATRGAERRRAALATWAGRELSQRIRLVGPPEAAAAPTSAVPPGQRAIAYLWDEFQPGAAPPAALAHRLTLARGASEHDTITTAALPLPAAAAPIASPVRGGCGSRFADRRMSPAIVCRSSRCRVAPESRSASPSTGRSLATTVCCFMGSEPTSGTGTGTTRRFTRLRVAPWCSFATALQIAPRSARHRRR